MKMALKGKCFQDVDEIKHDATGNFRKLLPEVFPKVAGVGDTCMDLEA